MDQFMNEMAIWNGMNTAFISNAIFFAACSFLIWVGFRFTSRIYYDGDVNLLGKIFTTLFCLSIRRATYSSKGYEFLTRLRRLQLLLKDR